jgi:hypothetical protein
MIKLVLLLWFLQLWTPNVHAEMYSWTDEKGIRHYSNTGVPSGQSVIDVQKEIDRINENTQENDSTQSSVSPVSDKFQDVKSSGDLGSGRTRVTC